MKNLNLKFLFLIVFLYSNSFSQTLKIVYNESTPPLKFTDTNNNPNGILIDIWKFWALKNNIDITFIESSWKESLAMIEDGRADIHAGLYYTTSRDVKLDYSKKILYKNKNYFFYNKEMINPKQISELTPFVIGIGNGYSNPFMKQKYKGFFVKRYETDEELSQALVNGEINVALSSMATMTYFIKKNKYDMNQYKYSDATHAYTKSYYGGVKQGNKKVLDIINQGFENITETELENIEKKWTLFLNENYLKDYHNKNIALTEQQKEYLLEKKEITMCVDPKWFPFESIEDGKHQGMIADIFKELTTYLPVPIKLIETNTWAQTLKYAKNKKCDILAGAVRTQLREQYLNFTKPYLKFPEVIVTREKEPFIEDLKTVLKKPIGIVKNSAIIELIRKKYPRINLMEVKSVSDGLMQVSQGKLYGFLNTTASISYYISKEGMTNLKIATKVGIDYHLSVAVRDDDLKLLDIFNTIITNLDESKIKEIKDHWLQVKVQEIVDYSIIYKIVAFFILVITMMWYWNRKLNYEILEREKVQKELNKFSQVIEQSRVSIIITDITGKIEYVNPFCIKKTGYSKSTLLSSTPSILKSGYQNDNFYKKLWSTVLSGKTWQGEFSNKKKNGTIFWESATIAPIFDKQGEIQFFASIKEDITDKVISREKLQVAQEEAILANGAKSEFLAKMSHEIRTPMNAVLGMLYLLDKTNIDQIQGNYIKKANYAANSLLGIINDILDFSKIEAGKLDINNDQFEFNEMIMNVLSVMSFKAEEKDLELLAHYDAAIPSFVISDKLRIEQILTNLLSNALKFTNEGEIIISTKLVKKHNSDLEIMFCVKDNGIGISSSAQEKLFQEFSQVDSSATRSFQGTGLGLAICKKLSNLLGGDIWIEDSKEGVGSTFCFTIKCEKSYKIKQKKYKNIKITDLKCLVVDDSNSAVEVLSTMLKSFNFSVKSASCGKDAISMIKNEVFDIIFLDYKMDELNGIETFEMVKSNLIKNNTKTIMVSAYSNDLINENIYSLGIEGYLSKPISPSSLYNKIIEVQNSIVIKEESATKREVVKYFDGVKVLLVEDNELNQEFAMHMLEDRGFIVDISSDGIEALSKVKNNKYDIVLMDIQMPHMDGLEATKHIRAIDGTFYKNLPIVALSANALLDDKEKSLEAGMNNHITKPINPEELFDVLSLYLECNEKVLENQKPKTNEDLNISMLNKEIFDVKNTLLKLNNSQEVYIKILKQFEHNYKNVNEEIYKLLDFQSLELLKNKIHEIKGVSGNIGAMRLYEKLVIIDRIIKKNEMPSLKLIQEFDFELNNVLDSISVLHNKEIEVKEFNKEEVVALLQSLLNNLEEDIVQCEIIVERLKPYLHNQYKKFGDNINTALDDFDTDSVKILIEKFLGELDE